MNSKYNIFFLLSAPDYFAGQTLLWRSRHFYSTNEKLSKKDDFKRIDLSKIEPLIKIVDLKISSSNINKERGFDYIFITLDWDYDINR